MLQARLRAPKNPPAPPIHSPRIANLTEASDSNAPALPSVYRTVVLSMVYPFRLPSVNIYLHSGTASKIPQARRPATAARANTLLPTHAGPCNTMHPPPRPWNRSYTPRFNSFPPATAESPTISPFRLTPPIRINTPLIAPSSDTHPGPAGNTNTAVTRNQNDARLSTGGPDVPVAEQFRHRLMIRSEQRHNHVHRQHQTPPPANPAPPKAASPQTSPRTPPATHSPPASEYAAP